MRIGFLADGYELLHNCSGFRVTGELSRELARCRWTDRFRLEVGTGDARTLRAILVVTRDGRWLAGQENKGLANPQHLLTAGNQIPMGPARLLDESCTAVVRDVEPSWVGKIEVFAIRTDHL